MKEMYLLPLLIIFSSLLSAQSSSQLSGTVNNPQAQPVANAALELSQPSRGLTWRTTSSNSGTFQFSGLIPGRYSLLVSAPGFQSESLNDIEIRVAGLATADFKLSVSTTTFTANSSAIPTSTDAQLPSVGLVVDRNFVNNLPLNGRSFQSLLELTPGIVLTNSTTVSAGQFSSNGQRTNANYFMVDGVGGNVGASAVATFSQQAAGTLPGLTVLGGTNSLVTLDALEEFRVQTSTFAPEFGRSPGAQISLATRSGTNRYHGSLFYELRNEKFDANDWFANAAGSRRAPFRLNQFGGTASGPLSIPKLYKGNNRTFFFFAFEGLRLRQPRFQTVQVPTESARRRATGPIQSLLNSFPLPNSPSPFTSPDEGLFRAAFSDPATTNISSLRIDHNFSSRLQLFARFSGSPTERTERVFANQITTTRNNLYTYTLGLNNTISPRLTQEFRFNYSTSDAGFNWDAGEFAGAIKPQDSLLFPSYTSRERASAGFFLGVFLPGISPPNLTQGRSIGNGQRQLNTTGNFAYTASSHQFKFGYDIRLLLPVAAFREYGVSYNFGSISNAIDRGLATISLQSLAPQATMSFPAYSLFAQDNWRITKTLTLNYGLRWEIVPPPSGTRERPIFGPSQASDPLTLTIAPAGTPLWQTRWNNFGPRLGLAWRLSRGFTVRGGVGLFHDLGTGQASRGFNSWPYNTVRTTMNAPFPATASALEPIPFNAPPPYSAEFFITDPSLRQPHTLHWSLGIEKDLSRIGVIDVRYVANRGRQLLFNELLRNRPAIATSPATIVVNPTLFTNNSNVNLSRNASSSNYQSLQVQFQRRAAKNIQTQVSYTLSHAIDNFSDETTQAASLRLYPRNVDRGPADFDVRHNLVVAMTAQYKGFSFDTISRARSGTPINVFTGIDPLNLGLVTALRPDRVLGQPLYLDDPTRPGARAINRAAFANPPAGRFGTLGRNSLRGLAVRQIDFAVRRDLLRRERFRAELRTDFFNIFNTPNFANPSGALNNAAFGIPQNMLGRGLSSGAGALSPLFQIGGPRSIQFALRITL
ncbi:MAG: hypothetical protein FJW36_22535 [Acidobacteria bacterium]|nr:hypothetical protein [Acidobacteriota bacterium]